ncbi:MiaB/RimO family radical SAM methylthiotransferase [Mucilaginibacter ginkgonis]|uniref:tRNA-2-methylthio-N(6)-dimethylallyladenosine synthase n=1 Tax=Mucilaginibacter ginkgonis TaxID=2682091 RepID=A0A6I4HZC0_9SPHI|nr:MiaB/RimO family radical SAM methylthiotransferase [Mucilaginibacter ginkgonis]QQL48778.1 tRNA (N6-isopentenyl adenosine(37)-C2)-methylthiotransferase MiaB [Mucilaginibacter ginkgonis]
MIDLALPDTKHDESRQGEALMLEPTRKSGGRKLYIESYGCAMNFSDSEIVASILADKGFETTNDFKSADVIFINTCSIRENAEQRVRNRLKEFKVTKYNNPGTVVGVLGCMAERLKSKFLEEEKLVDVVVGPDAYRDLPNLLEKVDGGQRSVNVLLSREETYADINPVRLNTNGINAFVSIMRGCDNMCSFCVVPFTRGRERSRDAISIVEECTDLFNQGYREVTLLGQNVDSYKWVANQVSPTGGDLEGAISFKEGRGEVAVQEDYTQNIVNFANLLEMVAQVSPDLRVRFSTSHPKDITDEVLYTMKKYDNICKYIHLPVQSGNSEVLDRMNRTYTREWYMNRIDAINNILPGCAISTDVITGFCGETEEQHAETLSMMDYVQYDYAYMFMYSERPGTLAAKRYADDIAEDVKARRLNEIIEKQRAHAHVRLQNQLGKVHKVLIEGFSKKSKLDYAGRNDQNAMVIFPVKEGIKPGQYINVLAQSCTSATLIGEIV